MSARSPEGPASAPKCPVCGKPQAAKFKPFCSKRCADVDLSRWLKGAYAIAAEDGSEEGGEERPEEGE
jgi:endogenous inhibitor of DNA gyrase (YacG/DUF329 family)